MMFEMYARSVEFIEWEREYHVTIISYQITLKPESDIVRKWYITQLNNSIYIVLYKL